MRGVGAVRRLGTIGVACGLLIGVLLVGGCAADKKPARRPNPADPGRKVALAATPNLAEDISRIIRARQGSGVPVQTIVVGNVAVAGVGRPDPDAANRAPLREPTATPSPGNEPPPGLAPRAGVPSGMSPPGPALMPTYTPRQETTGLLDRGTAAEVMRAYPFLKRIYRTTDPALVARIASVATHVRSGRPIDQRIDETAWIVRSVAAVTPPAAPTPVAPSPKAGTGS